ncbi:MAG: BadF/BadG/BcrA/BcrD ATPase family protein [Thermotogota bacterium]|nr:BadF/BadG/BcrA/BcrD ATPase family protein [Thermotogota bacterium]
MNYFLGIDGGGSTIRAALIDGEKKVLAHFKLHRNSNPTSTGFAYLKETLELIRQQIIIYCKGIKMIMINLAGVGASQQLTKTKEIVKEVFFETTNVQVYHDAHGSLLANSPEEASMLVICGTGSVIVGKDEDEHFYRAGGWGFLLGDEASGFWLVKRLFQEYLAYYDGIREDNRSFDVFREKFEVEPRDALYRFYEAHYRRGTAALSTVFLDREYPLAQQIIKQGIITVINSLKSMKERIKDEVKSIIYMGGMFESPFFLQEFEHILQEKIPFKKGKKDIEIELAMIGKEKMGEINNEYSSFDQTST